MCKWIIISYSICEHSEIFTQACDIKIALDAHAHNTIPEENGGASGDRYKRSCWRNKNVSWRAPIEKCPACLSSQGEVPKYHEPEELDEFYEEGLRASEKTAEDDFKRLAKRLRVNGMKSPPAPAPEQGQSSGSGSLAPSTPGSDNGSDTASDTTAYDDVPVTVSPKAQRVGSYVNQGTPLVLDGLDDQSTGEKWRYHTTSW